MNDIQLSALYAPIVQGGDWVVGDALGQQQALLLVTARGEWKQNPDVGVGAARYAESELATQLLREVRQQLVGDGLAVEQVKYNAQTGKLQIDADYSTT